MAGNQPTIRIHKVHKHDIVLFWLLPGFPIQPDPQFSSWRQVVHRFKAQQPDAIAQDRIHRLCPIQCALPGHNYVSQMNLIEGRFVIP